MRERKRRINGNHLPITIQVDQTLVSHVGNTRLDHLVQEFINRASTEHGFHAPCCFYVLLRTYQNTHCLPDARGELLGRALDAVPRGRLGDMVALLAAAVVVAAKVVALALLVLVQHAVAARGVVDRARHRLARTASQDVVRGAVGQVHTDGCGVVLDDGRVVVLDKHSVRTRGAVGARRDAVHLAVDTVDDRRAVRVQTKHCCTERAVDGEDLAQLVCTVPGWVAVVVHRRVAVERVRVRPHARVVRSVAVDGRTARRAGRTRHHVRHLLGQVAAQVLARVVAQADKARRLQRRVEALAHLGQVVRDRNRVALDLNARLGRGLAR